MLFDEAVNKLPELLKKDLNRDLCTCNQVMKRDIVMAIANGACSILEIRKETFATMGSACCKQQIERLIECICIQAQEK